MDDDLEASSLAIGSLVIDGYITGYIITA